MNRNFNHAKHYFFLHFLGNVRMERSRSPHRVDNVGRRRDNKPQDSAKPGDNMPNVMNPMLMTNMYPQGT